MVPEHVDDDGDSIRVEMLHIRRDGSVNQNVTVVVLISVAISVFLYYQPFFEISTGISVIICAVVASLVGAIFFPIKEERKEVQHGE